MAGVRGVSPSTSVATNALIAGEAWTGRVTFGFARDLPSDLAVSTLGATAAHSQLKHAVRSAFEQVEAFTKLAVAETSAGTRADLRVVATEALTFEQPGGPVNMALGAYAFMPGRSDLAGDIFVGSTVSHDLAEGSYGYRAVLHEVGHALGLKHPDEWGPYGTLTAALDGPEASVMSARTAPGASVTGGLGIEDGGYSHTYMPADIAALQHLYGANYDDARDSRYVFDPNEFASLETIWDGGGRDTYDFSRYVDDLSIDLAPGGYSTTGQEPQLNRTQELSYGDDPIYADGSVHNAFLFKGNQRSIIENAIGGWGDDTIEGNQAANRLSGGAGDDWLKGGGRGDLLKGGRGDDRLDGGNGSDGLRGGAGEDALRGGLGADTLGGGTGDDRANGGAGDDLLRLGPGRDRLNGGGGNDRLDGQDGDDWLAGATGDDQLFGGRGNDILRGGAGDDTLDGGSATRDGDRLVGGNGADVFVLDDTAVVGDFDAREGDALDVADPRAAFASLTEVAGNAAFSLDGGETVVLLGVALESLHITDFI